MYPDPPLALFATPSPLLQALTNHSTGLTFGLHPIFCFPYFLQPYTVTRPLFCSWSNSYKQNDISNIRLEDKPAKYIVTQRETQKGKEGRVLIRWIERSNSERTLLLCYCTCSYYIITVMHVSHVALCPVTNIIFLSWPSCLYVYQIVYIRCNSSIINSVRF